jgi:hypothetical protein
VLYGRSIEATVLDAYEQAPTLLQLQQVLVTYPFPAASPDATVPYGFAESLLS